MSNDIQVMRHSLEHVMVLAVQRVIDINIQLGVGPVIENGFYQDFDFQISPEQFSQIENEMLKILDEDLPFNLKLTPIDEALQLFTEKQQSYKVELLRDIKLHGTTRADKDVGAENAEISLRSGDGLVSIYSIGTHVDLCRGPHVARSSELKGIAFKLDRTAGAYWRGNEKNKMLCRIYGLAFEDQPSLTLHLNNREEAKKRDHRKLGEKLDLFFFHETAPGMPYWLPKGVFLKNMLIQFWRQYHLARNYQEIQAPLVNKKELWEISGHWKYFQEDMITCQLGKNEDWALKPMNCANAMLVWKHKPRSYRELPLRIADTDILHRNERTGTLAGLFRARCFCQDDSHNFVAEDQINSEIEHILEIVKDFYGVFGLGESVHLYLSTRPDNFMGDVETWDRAEMQLQEVLTRSGIQFAIKHKDGAFYGPKIDVHLTDSLNREWQCGTIQLDFQLPRNFNLEYSDQHGNRKIPVVIHRVIYGSLERFIGIIIEHFAGRLPFWISPIQIRVLPVRQDAYSYLKEISSVLSSTSLETPLYHNKLRFEIDDRNKSLSRRVRDAEVDRVSLCLIFGPKEENERTVVIRSHIGERTIELSDLSRMIKEFGEIKHTF